MALDDLTWRHDIDALVFTPRGHKAGCFIHRLAFRSLSGEGSRESCEVYFRANKDAFERAARAKIQKAGVSVEQNFHLTSRDVRRALAETADG